MGGRADALAAEIASALSALKSPKTKTIRAVRRRYSRQLATASASEILDVARSLLRRPGFVGRFVAYELVSHHRAAREAPRIRELEELGKGIDCWEAVDTFALYLETRRFLTTHRDRLVPRVLREVTNKLTTGLKNPQR